MALNFANINQQSMENLMPMFGLCDGVLMPNHANLINHLVSNVIPTVNATAASPSTVTGLQLNKSSSSINRDKVTSAQSIKNSTGGGNLTGKVALGSMTLSSGVTMNERSKDNQGGTAPMDLESDLDAETDCIGATPSIVTLTRSSLEMPSVKESGIRAANSGGEILMNMMSDTSSYLNGFLNHSNMTMGSGQYMLFPANAAATVTAGTSTNAPASVGVSSGNNGLLDTSAILAAAMQQLQQQQHHPTFSSYALTEATNAPDSSASKLIASAKNARTGESVGISGKTAKEVIKTKNFTLLPPNPLGPRPTIRERPLGCRTVFVGGLPENITEEHLREIFEVCGDISTLRMSKKNFCHIRFRLEQSIDRAITFSGYRICLGNSTINNIRNNTNNNNNTNNTYNNSGNNNAIIDGANYGRLHVDYAQARDDQYEYECKQRQLQREQRHREHHRSRERSRSESPPTVPHYSDLEASLMGEQLRKDDDAFIKAVQTIATWLERGDCNKRNANTFYSMLQSTHAHVRRLTSEKQQLENNLNRIRDSYRKQMQAVSGQFTQIEKVFNAASHKKVWDHFSKAQRKNIDQWKKLAMALRNTQMENDEMELSDGDTDEFTQSSLSFSKQRSRSETDQLKEENDLLRCQLEAMRNELRSELTDSSYNCEGHEQQIEVLKETIRNLQTKWLQFNIPENLKNIQNSGQFDRHLRHQSSVNELLSKTSPRKRLMHTLRAPTENSAQIDVLDSLQSGCSSSDSIGVGVEQHSQRYKENSQVVPIIDVDIDKSDDEEVKIVEEDISEKIEKPIIKRRSSANFIKQNNIAKSTVNCKNVDVKKDSLAPGNNRTCMSSSAMLSDKKSAIPVIDKTIENGLSLSEVHLVTLCTVYLLIYPGGGRTEQLCAYINLHTEGNIKVQSKDLNEILSKCEHIFQGEKVKHENIKDQEETSMLWKFCGLSQK